MSLDLNNTEIHTMVWRLDLQIEPSSSHDGNGHKSMYCESSHKRPSDEEIARMQWESKMGYYTNQETSHSLKPDLTEIDQMKHSKWRNRHKSFLSNDHSDVQIEPSSSRDEYNGHESSHKRPSDEEIARMQWESRRSLRRMGYNTSQGTSHGIPTNAHSLKPDLTEIDQMKHSKWRNRHKSFLSNEDIGHSSQVEHNHENDDSFSSDKEIILRFFPDAGNMYKYDANDSITSAAAVSFLHRKQLKKLVYCQWYFFTFGFVSKFQYSKHLSDKLAQVISDLTFSSLLFKKSDERCHI
jgi:hypothetical protein